MKKKVGLITYHAAHNYGSVLQAFATQVAINSLGADCTIINYRLQTQKNVYSILHFDKETHLKQYNEEILTLGPLYQMKLLRAKRFEAFIKKNLRLTKEYGEYEPCLEKMSHYDVVVSGSDQILNRNTGELSTLSFDYMRPYLADVVSAKRVSYASSFANANDEQLDLLGPYLSKFNNFSVREASWKDKVQKYFDYKIDNVCDPTFLLTKEDWIKLLNLKKKTLNKKYILFYTLYNYSHTKTKIEILQKLLKYYDLEIHIVAPFCEKSVADLDPRIVEILDCGPKEFLEELYNAEFVIPESFHGLALSIIFNKRFICPCGTTGPELRKIDLLNTFGLYSRWRPNFWEIKLPDVFEDFDYAVPNSKIEDLRIKSFIYLKKAILS